MNQNELITGWVYKKGELAKKRVADRTLSMAIIVSIVLSLIVAWPVMSYGSGIFSGRIGGWIAVAIFIVIVLIVNFIFKLFSNSIFGMYKMIFGVEEEEIIFTNYKISSTSKTWILNDDVNTLTSVKLNTNGKIKELSFKGTEQKPGKTSGNYSIDIPVPEEEMENAEKICTYFKNKIAEVVLSH